MAAPTWRFSRDRLNEIRQWFVRRPYWTLTLVVLAALVPFLAKPFNMDEPLFLWTAHQIQAHPGNPYGFDVNWYGTAMPMWSDLWDPPLASYYLALTAALLGWSEVALHGAFLLPALAVILGSYRLARHFCGRPMLAALVVLFSPAFLLSATTVMCDVLMLAFWVWAVVLWVEGMERGRFWQLAGAALLVSLAAMTKQIGVSLIPLLAVYSLLSQRRSAGWAFSLLLPLVTLAGYEWITSALYGQGLFFNAGRNATAVKETNGYAVLATGLTALTFTGGCLASTTFFAPLLWRMRVLAVFAAGTILAAGALCFQSALFKNYAFIPATVHTVVVIQIAFWAVGGMCVLALVAAELGRGRDPRSCLLGLWVLGIFSFASFFNWDVNGRTILLMAPAVGILLVRRLERIAAGGGETRAVPVCVLAGALLALLTARADFRLAVAVRQAAQQTCLRYEHLPKTLWFEGHWGFQYYMEVFGASAVDFARSPLQAGDHLAIPANNTNLLRPKPGAVTSREIIVVSGPRLLATMSETVGAGFYAAMGGPLPFSFGHVPPESVSVYDFGPQIQASSQASH